MNIYDLDLSNYYLLLKCLDVQFYISEIAFLFSSTIIALNLSLFMITFPHLCFSLKYTETILFCNAIIVLFLCYFAASVIPSLRPPLVLPEDPVLTNDSKDADAEERVLCQLTWITKIEAGGDSCAFIAAL